jgi:hypothetical protein
LAVKSLIDVRGTQKTALHKISHHLFPFRLVQIFLFLYIFWGTLTAAGYSTGKFELTGKEINDEKSCAMLFFGFHGRQSVI